MKGNKLSSQPTIRRLPSYLIIVQQAAEDGHDFISGTVIAQELELEPIQVRKDLAITGIIGKPRIGYPVKELLTAINKFLQWDRIRNAAIVGAGHLGQALMGNKEFIKHGLKIVAAFDTDPAKVGGKVLGIDVYALQELAQKAKKLKIDLAILTVPPASAQTTVEKILGAGIGAVWNFTNVKLKVPSGVIVQQEDLSSGYAVLCVKMRLNEN
jgi:redox-sensing transcriptional repressor